MIFDSKDRFLIIGDLHANSSSYAASCEDGGADAILLHLNQESGEGSRFGGIEIEEESLKETMSVTKVPVGISIGDSRTLLQDEWEAVVKLGFSFAILYAHQLPTFAWQDERISKLVSIGPGYILEQVKALSEFDQVSGIVAALTPKQGNGLPLTLLDLATLGLFSKLSSKSVYMPTQRSVRTQDIVLLKNQGCAGIMVSSTVYGQTREQCKETISKFKQESTKKSELPAVRIDNTQTFTTMR